ncbi:MAG: hypothetical protein QOD82_5408, partial [Pseudonocardiales bacterium]|nr:hypothetical protein [Pseudonocardiales bacterium]
PQALETWYPSTLERSQEFSHV